MSESGWGPAPSNDTILRAFKLSGFDYTDYVWWRDDPDGSLRVFVQCSDFFIWACADLEEITDDNIDSLEETIQECEDLLGKYKGEDGFLLWCSRMRKMRPQGAYYKHLNKQLWPLFDAAGPERATDFGNPAKRPDGD